MFLHRRKWKNFFLAIGEKWSNTFWDSSYVPKSENCLISTMLWRAKVLFSFCLQTSINFSTGISLGMEFLKVFKEWSGGRDPSFGNTLCMFCASHFPLLLMCWAALVLFPQLWWCIVLMVCPLTPVLAEDSAQSFGRGGSGWTLGKISVLKDWWNIGTSSLGKWRSHHSYKCQKKWAEIAICDMV